MYHSQCVSIMLFNSFLLFLLLCLSLQIHGTICPTIGKKKKTQKKLEELSVTCRAIQIEKKFKQCGLTLQIWQPEATMFCFGRHISIQILGHFSFKGTITQNSEDWKVLVDRLPPYLLQKKQKKWTRYLSRTLMLIFVPHVDNQVKSQGATQVQAACLQQLLIPRLFNHKLFLEILSVLKSCEFLAYEETVEDRTRVVPHVVESPDIQ